MYDASRYDTNWAGADALTFQKQKGVYSSGNYELWYGEDLGGSTQVDNAGTACVDVFYLDDSKRAEKNCIDIPMLGIGTSTHNYSPTTGAANAFDNNIDTAWDGCCKGYPNQEISYDARHPHLVNGYSLATVSGAFPSLMLFD
jgi:hypothetical protein